MLQLVHGDGSLADDGLVVPRRVLRLLVVRALAVVGGNRRQVVDGVLAEAFRAAQSHLSLEKIDGLVADQVLVAHAAGVDARAQDPPADHLAVLVVHRHGPADDVEAAEQLARLAVLGGVGVQAEVGQHLVLHAHEHVLVVRTPRARAGQAAPLLHRDELHVGRDLHRRGPHLVEGGALEMPAHHVLAGVQRRRVEVVGRVVLHLQPVAVLKIAEGHQFIAGHHREVALPLGKGRLLLGGAHVGEHQAVALEGLVGPLANRAGVLLGLGLLALREGHVQAGTVDVEHHAVVAAAYAAFLDGAVLQRGTTVHAMGVQQADATAAVAKGHEFLAEDLEEARRVAELHGHAHRMPEASHVLAQRRSGVGFCDLRIVLGDAIGVVAPVGDEFFRDRHRAAGGGPAFFHLVRGTAHVLLLLVDHGGHAQSRRGSGGFAGCARGAAACARLQSNMSGWVWRICSQMGWKCSQPMYSLPTCSRL